MVRDCVVKVQEIAASIKKGTVWIVSIRKTSLESKFMSGANSVYDLKTSVRNKEPMMSVQRMLTAVDARIMERY